MGDTQSSQLSFVDFDSCSLSEIPFFEDGRSEFSIPIRRLEAEFYDPIAVWLRSCWAPRESLREPLIEITANQGRRQTGGLWSRPDLVVVGICAYPFVPGKNLDLSTFEFKKNLEEGIAGVYESAAHSAFAHRSFLVMRLEYEADSTNELYTRIINECERFGLGLITLLDAEEWGTYRTVVEAKPRSPATGLMNRFIGTQISEAGRHQLLLMLK